MTNEVEIFKKKNTLEKSNRRSKTFLAVLYLSAKMHKRKWKNNNTVSQTKTKKKKKIGIIKRHKG
jgi:hypothetical protein